jgi:hypothetical protein
VRTDLGRRRCCTQYRTALDEGVDMSMISKFRRSSTSSRNRRTSRELARALRSAPTRASREELFLLQNR